MQNPYATLFDLFFSFKKRLFARRFNAIEPLLFASDVGDGGDDGGSGGDGQVRDESAVASLQLTMARPRGDGDDDDKIRGSSTRSPLADLAFGERARLLPCSLHF